MPRPTALSKVSVNALRAELGRRLRRLPELVKLKARVEADIAELQGLAGQSGEAAPAGAKVKVARKKRRKAKTAKVVAKSVAKKVRKAFKQTAQKFILRLLKAGAMTTAKLNERWRRIGRGGKADKTLGELVAAGTIKRAKLKVGKGSEYSVA